MTMLNIFPQLVPARARAMRRRVASELWTRSVPLEVEWTGLQKKPLPFAEAARLPLRPIRRPFWWGREYERAWFRVRIPSSCRGPHWFIEWKEQGEATLYVEGVPYAGLDVAHSTCRIPRGVDHVWIEAICLETGIWVASQRPAIGEQGCRFEGVRAIERNERAWNVLHDLDVLLNLLEDEYRAHPHLREPFGRAEGLQSPLENVSPFYRRAIRLFDEAVAAYSTGGLAAAEMALRKAYRALAGASFGMKCRLVGHAHIDLVWLWTEAAGEFKAVHTFATALRLMEEYPELRFAYSQPASYRAVERCAPELIRRVRRRMRDGKWEMLGASLVECDTQLPCGEALLRCLQQGQQDFVSWQGRPSSVLWLPDSFGFSACLPQIMRMCGISYFYSTKLSWNSVTRFPFNSFRWEGADGSVVLAHIAPDCGYNGQALPSEARTAARAYRQADVHDELLLPTGYGDGGGGPTAEMCERARRMRSLAGVPQTAWGRVDAFFGKLARVRDKLPAWKGELYLQYHRGIFTTHGDLKLAYRSAERALQAWEAAHCIADREGIDPDAWRRLLFAQFHDCLPGSSVREVYEAIVPELNALAARGTKSAVAALRRPRETAAGVVFNPLPLPRVAFLRGKSRIVPPLCVSEIGALATLPETSLEANPRLLRSNRVSARFDRAGRVVELRVDGARVAVRAPLFDLALFPDKPHAYDAWEIDQPTLANPRPFMQETDAHARIQPGVATLTVTHRISKRSRLVLRYAVRPHVPVLELECAVEWHEKDTLLKILFPTGYSGAHARFGAPFGSVLRPQQPGRPDADAAWECCGSRWAVAADDGEQDGLFVIAEAKYGWSCQSGLLGLSLLRGAKLPTRARNTAHEIRRQAGHTHSDQGFHRIRLAVGRFHDHLARGEQPAALAEALYAPLPSFRGVPRDAGFLGKEGGESLIPAWAAPMGNGAWLLRLHETLGRRGEALLRLAPDWRAVKIDASARRRQVLRGNAIRFAPYQVLSVEIRRQH